MDCSTRITITPLPANFDFEVAPAPGPHNDVGLELGPNWVTTTDPVICPLNNFKMMKGDGTGAYGGNFVDLNNGDGTLEYDSSQLDTQYLYVEFKSQYGTVYTSSKFTVTNKCKPVTMGAVPDFNYFVPATPGAPLTTVTDGSSYITNNPLSDVAICPRDFSLRDTGGGNHGSALLDWGNDPVLRVDTETKDT